MAVKFAVVLPNERLPNAKLRLVATKDVVLTYVDVIAVLPVELETTIAVELIIAFAVELPKL